MTVLRRSVNNNPYSWDFKLILIRFGLLIGGSIALLGFLFYFFPPLQLYALVAVFTKIHQRKLFLFYDEQYHFEQDERFRLASLTPADWREINSFLDLFVLMREDAIVYKRQLFLKLNGIRKRKYTKAIAEIVKLDKLRHQRNLSYVYYERARLYDIFPHHAYAGYLEKCSRVKNQDFKLLLAIEALYESDDWLRFERDIEHPNNTILRVMDLQMERFAEAYARFLASEVEEPHETALRLSLEKRRYDWERRMDHLLFVHYINKYREVYDHALDNPHLWYTLEHLAKPMPVEPELSPADGSDSFSVCIEDVDRVIAETDHPLPKRFLLSIN